MKKTKVLIVDDSLLVREILKQELERDVNIEVVGRAADAYEARNKIIETAPDILLVDVLMEKMSGIEFVKKLLPQYFVPVIMISADPSQRAESEAIASVTFLDKPQEGLLRQSGDFFDEILLRIKAIANKEAMPKNIKEFSSRLVALGASTGGAEAIEHILKNLPAVMPPVVIAQHMPPRFTKSFAERLNGFCALSVKEAENGEILTPGQVYIAPGGYHMSVKKRDSKYAVYCQENEAGNNICPSIDKLLESTAEAAPKKALGVLLTGMGRDGAAGLKKMFDAGCKTIGQDAKSSVIYGMPKAAYEMGAVTMQCSLNKMAETIVETVMK